MTKDFEYETSTDRDYLIEAEVIWTILDGIEVASFEFFPIRRGKLITKPLDMKHPDYDELHDELSAWFVSNSYDLEVECRTADISEPEYYES